MYDHTVDQKEYKWAGENRLVTAPESILPEFINLNKNKYKDWLV